LFFEYAIAGFFVTRWLVPMAGVFVVGHVSSPKIMGCKRAMKAARDAVLLYRTAFYYAKPPLL
jgi:hypothetical protein